MGPLMEARPSKWKAIVAVVAGLGAATPASAIHFTLIGDGTAQRVSTLSSTLNCAGYTQSTTWSVNGRILNVTSASLDWTGQDALRVWATARQPNSNFNTTCSDGWAAVDAREVSLVFQVGADPGDPDPLETYLRISSSIAGTLDLRAGVAGNPGTLTRMLQMTQTVRVDGTLVTADSLSESHDLVTGQTLIWSPAFPKGPANNVLVPNVGEGSVIEIRVWLYSRGTYSGWNGLFSYGPYGEALAVEINAQPIDVLDVPGERAPAVVSLSIRPNPAPGNARIDYTLSRSGPVKMNVYDLAGARVATLADRFQSAGQGEVAWDGRGADGGRLPAGVYLVELVAGEERRIAKLIRMN